MTPNPGRIGIGLLGASCTREEFDLGGTKWLQHMRLAEIERRILSIESELGFLNPGGQFGGVPFPDATPSQDISHG